MYHSFRDDLEDLEFTIHDLELAACTIFLRDCLHAFPKDCLVLLKNIAVECINTAFDQHCCFLAKNMLQPFIIFLWRMQVHLTRDFKMFRLHIIFDGSADKHILKFIKIIGNIKAFIEPLILQHHCCRHNIGIILAGNRTVKIKLQLESFLRNRIRKDISIFIIALYDFLCDQKPGLFSNFDNQLIQKRFVRIAIHHIDVRRDFFGHHFIFILDTIVKSAFIDSLKYFFQKKHTCPPSDV